MSEASSSPTCFFARNFIEELLLMGRRDAQCCLDTGNGREGIWRTARLEAFVA